MAGNRRSSIVESMTWLSLLIAVATIGSLLGAITWYRHER